MISRDFGRHYRAAWDNPPPLLTHDAGYEAANWHPLPSVPAAMPNQHAGPVMVVIPAAGGNGLGDDPLDPARQTRRRFTCQPGLMAGFEIRVTGRAS